MSATLLSEIAHAANVSTATVSRALRGLPGVSSTKRKEINEIANRLGKPVQKRSRKGAGDIAELNRQSNKTICILQTGDAYLFATDLFARQIKGVTRSARFHGLDVVLGFGNSLDLVPPCVSEKRVLGVLVYGHEISEEVAAHLQDIPFVWVASHAKLPASQVILGNDESGQLAAQYLIDRGHRNLTCLYPFRHQVMENRLAAFELKARQQGCQVKRIGDGKKAMPTSASAHREFAHLLEPIVDELLAGSAQRQGVFIPDDSITAHAYPLLRRRQPDWVRQLDIISFGNEPSYLAGLDPRPASIDIAPEVFGEQMVETLIWHIRHPKEKRRVRVHIEPFVVLP
jgi:DNA-binding LacI/PurR family transcriptional regulator